MRALLDELHEVLTEVFIAEELHLFNHTIGDQLPMSAIEAYRAEAMIKTSVTAKVIGIMSVIAPVITKHQAQRGPGQ